MNASQEIRPEEMEPIFVLGRQHSGNTMLTTLLGRAPSVLGVTREGRFFEVRRELDRLPPKERAGQTARCIRDDGVRALLRRPDVAQDMSIWKEVTPVMRDAAARGASATELYVLGMQEVLRRTGKERWAQKGTSYIFAADEILETFPRARLIFLVRNPFDLAASTAQRNSSFRHTARVAFGWNRGIKRALRLQASHPRSFMLLRYEDLVRAPERTVREVCDFCGLPFDSMYLGVPHVNKSDTPYNEESERQGLSASRVFYYRDVLLPVEQAAVRLGISRKALSQLYPELAEPSGEGSIGEQFQALGLLAMSMIVLTAEEGRRIAAAPSLGAVRVVRRLGRLRRG